MESPHVMGVKLVTAFFYAPTKDGKPKIILHQEAGDKRTPIGIFTSTFENGRPRLNETPEDFILRNLSGLLSLACKKDSLKKIGENDYQVTYGVVLPDDLTLQQPADNPLNLCPDLEEFLAQVVELADKDYDSGNFPPGKLCMSPYDYQTIINGFRLFDSRP